MAGDEVVSILRVKPLEGTSHPLNDDLGHLSIGACCGGLGDHIATEVAGIERVTGRKARGLQMEERGCRCQTFLSLLSGRKKQTSDMSFLLYTNLKGGFSQHAMLP